MNQQENSSTLLFNTADDRLKSQLSRIDGLDTKVGVVFGLSNAILIGLVGFLVFLERPIPLAVRIFATGSGTAYFVTLWLLLRAYGISKWSFRPNLETLQEICRDTQYQGHPDVIRQWIADECIRSYQENRTRLIDKSRLASQALIGLGSQAMLLGLAAIALIVN